MACWAVMGAAAAFAVGLSAAKDGEAASPLSAPAASAAGNRMSNLAIEFPPFGPFRLALNYGDNALNAQG